ncbi:hypothetical protein [Kiloniella antarctica]|uniref:Uncharacterized protein n=1 Tax=Kiloniella antarctica TaxID=1550907 RepID=A0ABW5BQH1_9PROT
MSLGLRETRRRRSHNFRWALFKWMIALILIGAAGWYSYKVGQDLAKKDVVKLNDKNNELEQTVQALVDLRDKLKAELVNTKQIASEWEGRYRSDVPTGELKVIVTNLQEKISNGVSLDRLGFLISSAENEQACDNNPVTKRFYVNTPIYTGVNDNVSFARGGVTITANGVSAFNAENKVEAWYDPAKSLDFVFTIIGGKQVKLSGKLPLHQSVVVNKSEYRFSINTGARGFVQVVGDRCDYP